MRNQRKLLLNQIDRKLDPFKEAEKVNIPSAGWVNSIRIALNMTLEQLGSRLNISKQGVKKIEEREASGSISINLLREVGNALDLNFIYGFVPKHGSIENLIDIKAKNLASKIVLRTNHNMKLENQENNQELIVSAIDELAKEIKDKMSKSLWD